MTWPTALSHARLALEMNHAGPWHSLVTAAAQLRPSWGAWSSPPSIPHCDHL